MKSLITSSKKNFLVFSFIWLCLGFFLGCLTLLGPLRWAVTYARYNNYSEGAENWLVRVLISAFVVLSFLIAVKVARKALDESSNTVKWKFPLGAFALALCALGLFLNPSLVNGSNGGSIDKSNREFTFGPYPTAEMLAQLKKEGYIGVISLLHPAVTPFEPMLLEDEMKAGKEIGIEVISVPMLPWVSQNEAAIQTIKKLAASPKGRYYVHCYLGRDRVNVVKRIIGNSSEVSITDAGNQARSLSEVERFERGPVVIVDNDVYLTPYPTDEEYLGYLIAAGVRQVVCLMDTTDEEARKRVVEEQRILKTYGIAYRHIPIPEEKNEKRIEKMVETVHALPRPVVIHRFFSDRSVEKKITEAYWKKYGKPVLQGVN